MSRVGRAVRVTALVAVAAGIAVGAARAPGTIELAPARDQAGLPQVSRVLVDEAVLACPGQQRLGATGLRDVRGDVRVAASAAPAATLRAAGVTPPPGRVRSTWRAERPAPSSPRGQRSTASWQQGSPPPHRSSRGPWERWRPGSWPPRSGGTPATTTEASP